MAIVKLTNGYYNTTVSSNSAIKTNIPTIRNKFYWEVEILNGVNTGIFIGFGNSKSLTGSGRTTDANGRYLATNSGGKIAFYNGDSKPTSDKVISIGDTVGFAIDLEEDVCYIYKNGELIAQGWKNSVKNLGPIYISVGRGATSSTEFKVNVRNEQFKYSIPQGFESFEYLNIKNNLNDMQIGDCIPCKYTATSNVAGDFSELGVVQTNMIPVNSSATPNGGFYFIKVDEGLLIADRVIQHSVSWDKLNAEGFIEHSLLANGLNFNGSTSYVNIPYDSKLSPQLISIKVVGEMDNWNVTTNNMLVSKMHGGGYAMYISNGKVVFSVHALGGYKIVESNLISPGKHTFHGVFDGRFLKVYIDGTLSNTLDIGSTSTIYYIVTNNLMIGVDPSNGTTPDGTAPFYFKGNIYEVAIWNKAINIDNIQENKSDLVGLWKFYNVSKNAKTITDLKNGVIATINNCTWNTNDSNKLIRCLTGGCSSIDNKCNKSLQYLGIGPWPSNNEWDVYIANSSLNNKIIPGDNNVWNWHEAWDWCKEYPVYGAYNMDNVYITTNVWRTLRGYNDGTHEIRRYDFTPSSNAFNTGGFRPVLEYIESDSKQTNLWY